MPNVAVPVGAPALPAKRRLEVAETRHVVSRISFSVLFSFTGFIAALRLSGFAALCNGLVQVYANAYPAVRMPPNNVFKHAHSH